jgi:hypothetical protein
LNIDSESLKHDRCGGDVLQVGLTETGPKYKHRQCTYGVAYIYKYMHVCRGGRGECT